ncbi:MAG: BREX-1 system adenine-specific DNA-methyltransferase PglX [Candidatus Omnitrophica bacterium]|nr:BREX-1 system adenine-specific DNA-methyltransferase PglX [Candidatus Omnitrophota bacterium]
MKPQSKANDAITFLEILTQKYDVAVANPPYTDSADFGEELKGFIEANYKKPYAFHSNLYATFIKRAFELTIEDGFFATIHPHTFMFIKSFEGVREYIINHSHIDLMVDYGLDRVNLFGPGILLDATFYVLSKKPSANLGTYFNITANLQEKYKYEIFSKAFLDLISGRQNDRVHSLYQSKLKIIKSWPFIYWISDAFREKFGSKSLQDVANVVGGITSGGNERFTRFIWEIHCGDISVDYSIDKKTWVGYAKGGPYNKWHGNLWLRLNWKNDGKEIVSSPKSVMRNKEYYFKEGITYSASGSKGASFRHLPPNFIFDAGGSCVFPSKGISNPALLAFLNSLLVSYVVNCLNPTVNTQVGDLKRIPFVAPSKEQNLFLSSISSRNIQLKSKVCAYSLLEIDYHFSPIIFDAKMADLRERFKSFFSYENHLLTQVLINEAIINEKIFKVYKLTPEDKAMVLAKEGESIGGLPVLDKARAAYLAEARAAAEFPLDNIRDFIEALPTTTLTEQAIADLNGQFDSLYQSNNDLEEFCIRNHINPINVWYLFQKSGVLPSQRAKTIAMEFLADLIRDILTEDEDGIVPLVRNAGEETLINRIEKKFEEKGLTSAQFSAFPTILGKEIDDYINNNFFAEFSDHLNLFMYLPKTPFIWHITSGPQRGFDAYIIIYKWNRDKLFALKSVYIEKRETALRNHQSDLLNVKSAEAENEKDQIFHQLKEIDSLKKKIDELLAEGYDPKLDDGVGKNIAPLQKKGIIACEVLNAGQLKKYLNADW